MNGKNLFAGATAMLVFALNAPAQAQLLGGGLNGAISGTLSGGLTGVGGIDSSTSAVTGSVRDINSIGRATTQHAHDTVSATADAGDRAASNVDKVLGPTVKSIDAASNAATSAASTVDAKPLASKVAEPNSAGSKPSAPAAVAPVEAPVVSAAANASVTGETDSAPKP